MPQKSITCLTLETGISKLSAALVNKLLKLQPHKATIAHTLQLCHTKIKAGQIVKSEARLSAQKVELSFIKLCVCVCARNADPSGRAV